METDISKLIDDTVLRIEECFKLYGMFSGLHRVKEIYKKLDQIKQKLADLEVEKQNALQDLDQMRNKLTRCQKEKKGIKANLNSVFENCDKHRNDIEVLKSKLRLLQDKYDLCTNEKDATETQLEQANQDLESTRTKLEQVKEEHQTMELDYRDKVQHLESKVRIHENNKMKLEGKLAYMKSKRIIKVKLFATRRPSTLVDFEDAVMAMLKSRIDDDVKVLVFDRNDSPDVVNTDTDPTIVLCFCSSNIRTDAKNAVKGLTLSSKMALVLIHYKDVYALPTQLSERVITEPEYKKLHFITDMAFLREKGIYPCEINNNSVVKLINFIKTEGKEYKKY